MTYHRSIILALIASACGCATVQAPRELVDARRAYAHASEGPARELVPAELLTAEQYLTRAERSFTDAPDATATRDLAYLAQRRAEIADARGILAADLRDRQRAADEVGRLQAARQASTQVQLSETRAELAFKDRELTAEQRARRTAEQRARAAMASLEKIAAVKEEARGLVITLNGSVLFVTGQSTLLPIAQERLAEVARALTETPHGAVTVEGHTDSVGAASANDDLSRRRAEAVRDYLTAHGVPADRVRAVGLGSNRPVADNHTPEGRANNRRVEIIVQPEPAPM